SRPTRHRLRSSPGIAGYSCNPRALPEDFTMVSQLSHLHRFEAGTGSRPLLLLHGTGGDEHDLIDLGRAVAPDAPLLSPRGQVKEGHANRFFRRLTEGVFDVTDLKA